MVLGEYFAVLVSFVLLMLHAAKNDECHTSSIPCNSLILSYRLTTSSKEISPIITFFMPTTSLEGLGF